MTAKSKKPLLKGLSPISENESCPLKAKVEQEHNYKTRYYKPKGKDSTPPRSTRSRITIEKAGDLQQFVKLVYKRLKVYRGIYLFYSIVSFMLGLPVLVTGFNQQFSSEEHDILESPHYLGLVALLSCATSLWCALRGQIVNCVLTLFFGLITVVAALMVLIVTAINLSKDIEATDISNQHHLQQQRHVIFISSMILFLSSLGLVITAISHLSNRTIRIMSKSDELVLSEDKDEEIEQVPLYDLSQRYRTNSLASTISSLLKHELKDNKKVESSITVKLKKTVSCPMERPAGSKKEQDLIGLIVSDQEWRGRSCSLSPAQKRNSLSPLVGRRSDIERRSIRSDVDIEFADDRSITEEPGNVYSRDESVV